MLNFNAFERQFGKEGFAGIKKVNLELCEEKMPGVTHWASFRFPMTHVDFDRENAVACLAWYLDFHTEVTTKIQDQAVHLLPGVNIDPIMIDRLLIVVGSMYGRAMGGSPKFRPYLNELPPTDLPRMLGDKFVSMETVFYLANGCLEFYVIAQAMKKSESNPEIFNVVQNIEFSFDL